MNESQIINGQSESNYSNLNYQSFNTYPPCRNTKVRD